MHCGSVISESNTYELALISGSMRCLFIPPRGFLVTSTPYTIKCKSAGLVMVVTVSDIDANIFKALTKFDILGKKGH
jgi:hypothetical protein